MNTEHEPLVETDQDQPAAEAGEAHEHDGPTPAPPPDTLAVILAAGAGSRFNAQSTSSNASSRRSRCCGGRTNHALLAGFAEVLVVEGGTPVADLVPSDVSIVNNHDWARRPIPIAAGCRALRGNVRLRSRRRGTRDQPFVPPEAWRRVAASDSPIAVASFDRQTTPPVRLHGDVWGLLPLDGDEGARQLLRSRPELVREVRCPGSAVDVDTVVDFDQVRRNSLTGDLGSWT